MPVTSKPSKDVRSHIEERNEIGWFEMPYALQYDLHCSSSSPLWLGPPGSLIEGQIVKLASISMYPRDSWDKPNSDVVEGFTPFHG